MLIDSAGKINMSLDSLLIDRDELEFHASLLFSHKPSYKTQWDEWHDVLDNAIETELA